jgi:hypothetical protein
MVENSKDKATRETKLTLILAIAGVTVLIVAAFFAAMVLWGGDDGGSGGPQTFSDVEEVGHTFEQDMISGDVTVHITVQNLGNTMGPAVVEVTIHQDNVGTIVRNKQVYVAAGETIETDLTLDCPWGITVYGTSITVTVVDAIMQN